MLLRPWRSARRDVRLKKKFQRYQPTDQCNLEPPGGVCCRMLEWTRYWYNSTEGTCQAVGGSHCCNPHLSDAFETMEECQKGCKVEEKIPEVPKPIDQCNLEPDGVCCRLLP